MMAMDLSANCRRFDGIADCYDRYRPQPPPTLVDVLTQLAGVARPRLVVDLGCGTGLSTWIWANHADQVIGIDPNAEMLERARAHSDISSGAGDVQFREGLSSDTGLADGSADIVTCSQSLHWMEPTSSLGEVARILRSGGVLAAYDCDWPPTMHWEAEQAYRSFVDKTMAMAKQRNLYKDIRRWGKSEHLQRMKDTGLFRSTREVLLHHVEFGDAERLVQLALSQGGVATVLKSGLTEEDIGVDALRAEARRTMGDKAVPWYFSYRIRLAIK